MSGLNQGPPAGSSGRVNLTIVIPAFNEAERLEVGFDRLMGSAKDGAFDPEATEIIVVDDGSTDETASRAWGTFADFPLVRVHSLPANSGKGAAVRAGVRIARGRLVAHMDADMAIHPSQVAALTEALSSADLAIGTRTEVEATSERVGVRSLMGRSFNLFVNGVTRVGLHDTQCGFKAFRTPVARLLFHLLTIERFAFDVQVVANARRLGFSIAEVPVHWQHVADSRVRLTRDPMAMIVDVLRTQVHAPAPPLVPAVSVAARRPGIDAEAVATAVLDLSERALALAVRRGQTTLVLLPLRSEEEVGAIGSSLGSIPGSVARQMSVSGRQLANLAPLVDTAWLRAETGAPRHLGSG